MSHGRMGSAIRMAAWRMGSGQANMPIGLRKARKSGLVLTLNVCFHGCNPG